ncbi:unnamed protein product, partial [Polarella glacialis]
SFFGLLRTGFPQVSGVLSFGKPAVLLAEGPLVELQRLVIEVRKFPWWWDVQEKQFDVERVRDTGSWRAFEGFAKVKTE